MSMSKEDYGLLTDLISNGLLYTLMRLGEGIMRISSDHQHLSMYNLVVPANDGLVNITEKGKQLILTWAGTDTIEEAIVVWKKLEIDIEHQLRLDIAVSIHGLYMMPLVDKSDARFAMDNLGIPQTWTMVTRKVFNYLMNTNKDYVKHLVPRETTSASKEFPLQNNGRGYFFDSIGDNDVYVVDPKYITLIKE